MVINAFMPIAEFIGFWGMKFGFKLLDNGFSRDEYKTKKKSI